MEKCKKYDERKVKALKRLYKWFDENRNNIIKNNIGDYVLIHNNSIVGYYKDHTQALSAANSKKLKVNTFLVQKCVPENEEVINFFSYGASF